MNDKERDRSDDGGGPRRRIASSVPHAVDNSFGCHCHKAVRIFFLSLLVLLSTAPCHAYVADRDTRLKGLSLHVGVGMFFADDASANFYNGDPGNANTLMRILHSETYGNQIWNDLTSNDLIASSVANYNQITVAEYGDMYYRMSVQLGFGMRYDLVNPHWAWLAKFDYCNLQATGAVLLNSGHGTAYLTNRDMYVVCPTVGKEERIYIDLGMIRKFSLRNGIDLEVGAGVNLNNTKVESSDINIGNHSYSILDIWGGQSPSSYIASYEYVNQGGIGYGAFASLSVGYTLPIGTAVSLAYTLHYNKVNLIGYEAFAFHHAFGINIALNNFSFFG